MSAGDPGSGGSQLPGRHWEYRYDSMGNRTSVGPADPDAAPPTGNPTFATDVNDAYALNDNGLNQYGSKQNKSVRVLGTAHKDAKVSAQSDSGGYMAVAKLDRSYAADVQPLNNSSAPSSGNATIYAALTGAGPNGTDLLTSQTRRWQIAQQLQQFSYDLDGNMSGDGLWTYTYDGENRLIQMQSTPAAISAGLTNWVLQFKYDFMGRRVQKRADNITAGTDVYRGYLYDGWNVVAEYAVNNPTATTPSCGSMQRSFTWGLDVAGSASATGGVGALVQITDQVIGKTYFPTYDGNGNVSALLDSSNGTVAVLYEYSPFGEILRAEVNPGISAAERAALAGQPFRFSTKWTDTESGLSYYGLRYYSPILGRFINRDPVAEQGGLNLYGFCGNNGVNSYDFIGLHQVPRWVWDNPGWAQKNPDGTVFYYSGSGHYVYDEVPDGPPDVLPPYETKADRLPGDMFPTFSDPTIGVPSPGAFNFTLPGLQVFVGSGGGSSSTTDPKRLSRKECDDLATKIGNNEGTLANIAKRQAPSSPSPMAQVWSVLDTPGQGAGVAHDAWEGLYRIGKASAERAGAPMRDIYKNVAKYSNGLDNVLKVKDVWQLGMDIDNRDGLMFISHAAEMALGWTNWTPGLNLVTLGSRLGINTAIGNLQDGVNLVDATGSAAYQQQTAYNVKVGLRALTAMRTAYKNGGCSGK
jgi:RHS repeat-associated protein